MSASKDPCTLHKNPQQSQLEEGPVKLQSCGMNHSSLCLTERVFESTSWRNSFLEVITSYLNPCMTSCSQANALDRLLLCQLSLLCSSSGDARCK